MVILTGDTHGGYDVRKFNKRVFNKDDILIILGDFGFVWGESPFLPTFVKQLGCRVLFLDGNHEDFDKLNSFSVSTLYGGKVQKVCENCYHLMRGESYFIEGKKYLVLGGAESIDKACRTEGISWWKEESITEEDLANAISNCNDVDYVLTHCCPSHLKQGLTLEGVIPSKGLVPEPSCDKLEELEKHLTKDFKWFFGHYHADLNFGKFYCLFNTFYIIGEGWVG